MILQSRWEANNAPLLNYLPRFPWIRNLNAETTRFRRAVTVVSKINLRGYRDEASSHNSKMRTDKVNLTSPARTIDALLKTCQRQQKLHKGEEGDFR